MDNLVQKTSTDIAPKTSTDISIKETPSSPQLYTEKLTAYIGLEHDITGIYTIEIENVNNTEDGYLIFGAITDGQVFGGKCRYSYILFEGTRYEDFVFMDGLVYNKEGRIGKKHVMIQIRNLHEKPALPPRVLVPEIVEKEIPLLVEVTTAEGHYDENAHGKRIDRQYDIERENDFLKDNPICTHCEEGCDVTDKCQKLK